MTISHQYYNHLAVRFIAGVRLCGRSQKKLHTSSRFSLKVMQPYDARTIVLPSLTGLLPDVISELQDCCKFGLAAVVQTSWAVVRFIVFLRQPCNNTQGDCTVILQHLRAKYMSASSCDSCTNALLFFQQPCVPCGSLEAVLHPHKIPRMNMSNI